MDEILDSVDFCPDCTQGESMAVVILGIWSSFCGGTGQTRKTLARRRWGRPANEARWLSPHSQSQKARVLSPGRYFFAGFSYKRVHRIYRLAGLISHESHSKSPTKQGLSPALYTSAALRPHHCSRITVAPISNK
jgi:hypothetical protein